MIFRLVALGLLMGISTGRAVAAAQGEACQRVSLFVSEQGQKQGWHATWRCASSVGERGVSVPEDAQLILSDPPSWTSGALRATFTWTSRGLGTSQSLQIPGVLTLSTSACRVRTAAKAGEILTPELTEISSHVWPVGVRPKKSVSACPQGRLRKSVAAGSSVSEDDVADSQHGLQGDVVTLNFRDGGLTLQTTARLLGDVRSGARVRVQPMGRSQVLEGTYLAESKSVEVLK